MLSTLRAATIAARVDPVGADKRWCEVNHLTYESAKQENVQIIGDATIGVPVPKSGNVANNMGKVSAVAIAHPLSVRSCPRSPPATPATAGSTTTRPSPW